MLAVKPTQMRDQFKALCDQVVREDETVIVSRPNNENVVVVSEKQYNAMLKAVRNMEYLEMVDRSMKELEEGGLEPKTLDELRGMEQ